MVELSEMKKFLYNTYKVRPNETRSKEYAEKYNEKLKTEYEGMSNNDITKIYNDCVTYKREKINSKIEKLEELLEKLEV